MLAVTAHERHSRNDFSNEILAVVLGYESGKS